jgi:hypothetical protein
MQRLNPLQVPWQVSPSTPFLRLIAAESSEDCPTRITFVANFGLLAEPIRNQEVGFRSVVQSVDPYALSDKSALKSKTHCLVMMEFQGSSASRISPSHSDREVIDPKKFDFSSIPSANYSKGVAAWLRDFRSLWAKTGNCPDPRAYSVEDSQWQESRGGSGLRHFLIQGHDAYVEVLARGWKWEEIQKLPEWW